MASVNARPGRRGPSATLKEHVWKAWTRRMNAGEGEYDGEPDGEEKECVGGEVGSQMAKRRRCWRRGWEPDGEGKEVLEERMGYAVHTL